MTVTNGADARPGPSAEGTSRRGPGPGGRPSCSAERRKKRDVLAAQGIDPYPFRFDRTATAADAPRASRRPGPDIRTGESVRMAGRLTSIRGHGKLSFATLQDVSGSIQLLMQASALSERGGRRAGQLDLGDWIGAEGEVVTSRRGELSVDVTELRLLSKSLRPLPDKWHGLTATDTRYRQREVDLLANPDSRAGVRRPVQGHRRPARACWSPRSSSRWTRPILQPQAGGALARPFLTHSNALDIDLSLRIAPELYLKRLVVGGYERVFEIARNFRNEGIDTRHSPEFTALEAYRAFGDVTDGMDLTERLDRGRGPSGHRPARVHRGRPGHRPHPAVAPAPAARLAGGGGRPPAAPDRPGGGRAGGVRRARRATTCPSGARASSSSSCTTPCSCR